MAKANCCYSQKIVVLPGLYVWNWVSSIVMHVLNSSLVQICYMSSHKCDAFIWKVSAGYRSVHIVDAALVAVLAAVAFALASAQLSLPIASDHSMAAIASTGPHQLVAILGRGIFARI